MSARLAGGYSGLINFFRPKIFIVGKCELGDPLSKGTKKKPPARPIWRPRGPPKVRKSPREAGPKVIKKAGLGNGRPFLEASRGPPKHKCRISPREAGPKLIKKDGPKLNCVQLDKSLNKGLISEDRNARLLCFVQYPVLVQVVCMGFISGGSRFWFLQRASGFSPLATR